MKETGRPVKVEWPRMRREPVTVDVRREEYVTVVSLRTRRSWRRLSAEERVTVLRVGAEQLQEVARQMLAEAEEVE